MALPYNGFSGFDTGNLGDLRLTGVPASFFTRLLPQINNLNELKVLLYFMFLAGQKRGDPKWVGYWELESCKELLKALQRAGDPRPPQEHLREGLELALQRGTLLRLMVAPAPAEFAGGELEPVTEPAQITWFLLNTSANRDFVKGLEEGKIPLENTTLVAGLDPWDWALPPESADPNGEPEANPAVARWKQMRLTGGRQDIYTLYEQNIGVLTPIMSERLREAARTYPAEWIELAFREAVNYNRRNWAYISRILDNWATEGRVDYGYEREGQADNRRAKSRAGRRADMGGTGDGAPDAQPAKTFPGTGGTASSGRAGRPGPRNAQGNAEIDFAKYTTGKYAYLTAPRRSSSKDGSGK